MKAFLIVVMMCLVGCSNQNILPDGVELNVAPSEDVIISLEDNRAVVVGQFGAEGRKVIVANIDGQLSVTQLEKGGFTPIGLDITSEDSCRISIERNVGTNLVTVVDEDGDGIPEFKVEDDGLYRVGEIKWIRQ